MHGFGADAGAGSLGLLRLRPVPPCAPVQQPQQQRITDCLARVRDAERALEDIRGALQDIASNVAPPDRQPAARIDESPRESEENSGASPYDVPSPSSRIVSRLRSMAEERSVGLALSTHPSERRPATPPSGDRGSRSYEVGRRSSSPPLGEERGTPSMPASPPGGPGALLVEPAQHRRLGRLYTTGVGPITSVTQRPPALLDRQAIKGARFTSWAQMDEQELNSDTRNLFDQVLINVPKQDVRKRKTNRATRGQDKHNDSKDDRGFLCFSSDRGKFYIHPEAKFRIFWCFVGMTFIIWELFTVPLYLSFDIQHENDFGTPLFWVGVVVNTYFLLDIPLTFMTAFVDHTGVIVTKSRRIAANYAKSWLLPDVVTAIPFEWAAAGSPATLVRFVRAVRVLRLIRFIRVVKLRSSMQVVETLIEASKIFTFASGVARTITLLLAMTHWSACIWYVVGKDEEDTRVRINLTGETDLTTAQHYVYCLYFAWTTMSSVGYGDITPRNFKEVCFVLVLLFVSSIVFAYLMGSLTDLITTLNSQTHMIQERKTKLSRYMSWRGVNRSLAMSIRQHLLFMWETNKGYDAYEEEIKRQLPPVLKAELCFHIYGTIIRQAPFLSWLREFPICIKHLANMVQSLFLELGDYVFQIGHNNQQIYVLLTGEVSLSRHQNIYEGLTKTNFGEPGRAGLIIPRKTESLGIEGAFQRIWKGSDSGRAVSKDSTDSNNKEVPQVFSIIQQVMEQQEKKQQKTSSGSHGRKNNFFDSEVLTQATVELRKMDLVRRNAVMKVQKHWRERAAASASSRLTGSAPTGAHRARRPSVATPSGRKAVNKMTSKTVEAPAFFGESCLWVPLDQWENGDPPTYMYSARCKSRCEFVYIARHAVLEVLDYFHPWLAERFEFFRQAVVQGLAKDSTMEAADVHPGTYGSEDSRGRVSTVDFHARDLERADLSSPRLSVNHSNGTLSSTLGHSLHRSGTQESPVPIVRTDTRRSTANSMASMEVLEDSEGGTTRRRVRKASRRLVLPPPPDNELAGPAIPRSVSMDGRSRLSYRFA